MIREDKAPIDTVNWKERLESFLEDHLDRDSSISLFDVICNNKDSLAKEIDNHYTKFHLKPTLSDYEKESSDTQKWNIIVKYRSVCKLTYRRCVNNAVKRGISRSKSPLDDRSTSRKPSRTQRGVDSYIIRPSSNLSSFSGETKLRFKPDNFLELGRFIAQVFKFYDSEVPVSLRRGLDNLTRSKSKREVTLQVIYENGEANLRLMSDPVKRDDGGVRYNEDEILSTEEHKV